MGSKLIDDLPSRELLDEKYPMAPSPQLASYRKQTEDILAGRDKRLIALVGPCSAHPPDAVYETADMLARVQEDIKERILVIMRMVITKPRSRVGYKGPLIQPDPEKPENIRGGIYATRKMYHRVGQQLPMGDEMVYTDNAEEFDNPLTYIWVGARTTLSQQHREAASGLESSVGMKNPTSGSLERAVDSVVAAQSPHHRLSKGQHILTDGNPNAHLILRGTENEPHANYDPSSIAKAHRLLRDPENAISNPAIMVDASHDNCRNGSGRDPYLQELVIASVMLGIEARREEYESIRGFMIESFPEGKSITDPCLPLFETEECLRETADKLDTIW